ncbi:glutathione S-transferase [Rhodovarius crocodyli]|uniref:Glutathione S-transferase n=1 Tax=Rhodovarius crocodyli TaxID=1979269 RepID=A0A437MLU0_9PROT|nr:glutathione S-transferase [Rhodovarius crocodyli]RVT98582.1 glutathione S-transferase [Rhodovarius crocodyli]
MTELTLHGGALSGHVHRVMLLARMLGVAIRMEPAPPAVRQSDAFRAMNPLGQIPVLQDGALVLSDSNAIMVYLMRRYGAGSAWIPTDPVLEAEMQRWLSLAAGELAFGPARARLVLQFGIAEDLPHAQAIAARLLGFMQRHLAGRDWLVGSTPSIADLALASYVAVAPEGGVSLAPYPAVTAWLSRLRALPGWFDMPAGPNPVEAAA